MTRPRGLRHRGISEALWRQSFYDAVAVSRPCSITGLAECPWPAKSQRRLARSHEASAGSVDPDCCRWRRSALRSRARPRCGEGADAGAYGRTQESRLPDPATRAIVANAAASRKNTPLKVICSSRLMMEGDGTGRACPSVGMIWTISTSETDDTSTSSVRGGLAEYPPSQYRSPPTDTAWLRSGRQAEARTISRVSSVSRKICSLPVRSRSRRSATAPAGSFAAPQSQRLPRGGPSEGSG